MLKTILREDHNITGFEIKQTFKAIGERILLLNARQIFRKDSIELLILLAIEDVTEAKKLEAELKLSALELERQVEERTASLKDANLSLRHSNDDLKQFATIASHDLQEPVRKIRTFVNLLTLRHSEGIAAEAREILEKISLSAERMSLLIKDVLNFSKISDAGLVFEKTDLNTIMQQVIADFDLLITQKQASVNLELLPIIDAVPLQIHQLFSNLLGNALKFSKKEVKPQITISAGMLPSEEMKRFPALNDRASYCEIVFGDNGIGFDQRFAVQMFLIFQRLNALEDFDGTGIGLALCKRAVLNHRGEIYAEAELGKGAQFHVILPLKQ